MNPPSTPAPAAPGEQSPPVYPKRCDRIQELVRCHTALSESQARLLHRVFGEIVNPYLRPLRKYLHGMGVRRAAMSDLVQEVFLTFYRQVVAQGFPRSIEAKLISIAYGKVSNDRKAFENVLVALGVPSSLGKPVSGRSPESVLDLKRFAREALPSLSKEHQAVVELILLRELTHAEAAKVLGLARTTVSSRLEAAEDVLRALARKMLTESERGGP